MVEYARQQELKEFTEAKLGLFVHFGLYSLLGRGEWVQHVENIPAGEYEHLMKLWNCRDFDAENLVRLARQAGMNYITFTIRHHEGFSLFDTDLSDFKSTRSAAKRDLVREMTEACRKHGLKIFYYYSLPDWHREDYATDFPSYRRFVIGQIKELLTRYGRVDGLWFDNLLFYYVFPDGKPLGYPIEAWDMEEIYDLAHELQPHLLIGINRVNSDISMPEGDDIDLAEFHVPDSLEAATLTRPWEICDTFTPGVWGWDVRARETLDARRVIEKILISSGKGLNLLFNIGPEKYGAIPEGIRQTMREVGLFTHKYREAIYGVIPVSAHEGNYIVKRGNRLYGYLMRAEDGAYRLDARELNIREIRLLSSGEKLPWSQMGAAVAVHTGNYDLDPWYDLVELVG